jgi:D-alanyl-D-alanine carboxypeptidase/D-alanyl-D-alanine-endopeptidase (penicillin-binding protein 4)
VRRPPSYFGAVFLHTLTRAGISVEKGFKEAEKTPSYERGELNLLGELESSLTEIINVINKKSHNHCADQLFKLSGWKVTGKGTFLSGEVAAKRMFTGLVGNGVDPITMADGSGLSRNNRFSAHHLVSLLSAIYGSSFRDTFIRSLPISGKDGSLKRRMKEEPYVSRVRAKTGWIRSASALSGYAQSLSGEVFAFSVLFNDYKGNNSVMKSLQDRICRILVDS